MSVVEGRGNDAFSKLKGISERQRALLRERLGKDSVIPPAPRSGGERHRFPLSPMQERLWLSHEVAPDSPMYNVPMVGRLRGPLDVEALTAAYDDLIARHEILRTTFAEEGEDVVQVVAPSAAGVSTGLSVVAVTDARAADEAAAGFCGRPMDLVAAPPVKARLYRIGAEDHILALVLHHIVFDAWSERLLWDDFTALYRARLDGGKSAPEAPRLQFGDFTVWQRDRLDGPRMRMESEYWRNQLEGAVGTELSTDRPRPPVRGGACGQIRVDFGTGLSVELAEYCREAGTTVFAATLTAFIALLNRETTQDDIVIGSLVSGRTRSDTQGMIGPLLNTVTLRTDVTGDPTFAELSARVRETIDGALAHQEIPFQQVLRTIGVARDPSRHPLFQILFLTEGATSEGMRGLDFGGARLDPYPTVTDEVEFDLVVGVTADGDQIRAVFEFAAELFDESRIEAIGARFKRFVAAMVTRPALSIGHVDVLSDDERELLLREWVRTVHPVPETTVLRRFEETVARVPDQVAVVHSGESLSFSELDARANKLARSLAGRGIGTEQVVGLALPRSLDSVVSVLATLKCGAAYLPIDPDHPVERVRFMLADAEPAVVITTAALATSLPEPVSTIVLDNPEDAAVLAALPGTPIAAGELVRPVFATNAVYVLYTSGSTGKPKGVQIDHRGLINLYQNQLDTVISPLVEAAGGEQLRAALNAPLSFDTSWEAIMWMIAGNQVHVVPDDVRRDPERMVGYIREQRIDFLDITPSYTELLVEAGLLDDAFHRPTMVAVGGEAIGTQLWTKIRDTAGVVGYNLYGPTECTNDTLGAWLRETETPRIGRPLRNIRVYVLDERLRPVPVGVPGELYIAGRSLGRGYLNRPSLTAARFVADPFGERGTRMYRSGDVVRRGADGSIDFLGRVDDQVKVRGFRIELGEINSVLAEHSDIAHVATIVREDLKSTVQQLVAYVVPREGRRPDTAALRRHVASKLPEHMIPAVFVEMASLPLSVNGKLDRGALPPPDAAPVVSGRQARSAAEQILCEVFAHLLGVPVVKPDDDFFALGGHSLLATRLVNKVKASLGRDLSVRALFEAPTPSRLAVRLNEASGDRPPVRRLPRPDKIPLSFAQRRIWFANRFDEQNAAYNNPVAFRLTGPLNREALEAALGDVCDEHEALRTFFPEVEGSPYQEILSTGRFRPRIRLVRTTDAELENELISATRPVFDLQVRPPVRVVLFQIGPEEHVLLFVLHHIIDDGWSTSLLTGHLARAYAARMAGEEPARAGDRISYVDYALWQRELLGDHDDPTELLGEQLRFWEAALAGLPDELALPVDRDRSDSAGRLGDSVLLSLDDETHRLLLRLARSNGVTVFMVMQAALAALLTRAGGATDVPLGTPVAGRADELLDDVIGFFVNTLVLRTDTSGDPTFGELLARVRATDLAAYAHQDVPFERVVEVVNPVRSVSRHPLFQVMLTTNNNEDHPLELPGIVARLVPVETGAAKFDLLVEFSERSSDDGTPSGMDIRLEYR
ncbi:amino acid adenylation domain-containing protein, partial [Amycolatopsis lurida]|uniref:amino acid adenylation domain-containing protein n=1 Tax=Amycolatopsis lurida TaxID=31959 RepID=UPI003650F9D6